MSTSELQSLKIAWLAAKEAGDTQAQYRLLRDHPEQQAALIDFIAAYHATAFSAPEGDDPSLTLLTQRALNTALSRVFPAPVLAKNLTELRKLRNMDKSAAAAGLRLSVEVWNLFEEGRIQVVSLSQRQLDRLAHFFQVSVEQFSTLLSDGQAATSMSMLRRQKPAGKGGQQEPVAKTIEEAILHSRMSKEDKKYWLE